MNKINFINNLEIYLQKKFSEDEVADYEGFFMVGIEEGKNEEQICTELGNPSAIALDLAETLGKNSRNIIKKKILTFGRAAVFVGLSVFGIIYYFNNFINFTDRYLNLKNSIALVAFSALLWFAFSNASRKTAETALKNIKLKRLFWIGHGILFVMSVIPTIKINNIAAYYFVANNIMPSWDSAFVRITMSIEYLATVFLVITIFILIAAVYFMHRFSAYFFSVTVHALGVMAYLVITRLIYGSLSDLDTFVNAISGALAIYAFALISAIGFSYLSYLLLRGCDNGSPD